MHADFAETGSIPDSRGINIYRADRDAAPLFAYYLPKILFAHLEPIFDRLGGLAGDRLDRLAAIADKNPPVLALRCRTGEDCNRVEKHPAYLELEKFAFGEFGLAAISHRGALGWNDPMPAAAKYALTFLFAQSEFGLMCPVSMTDSLTLAQDDDEDMLAAILEA
jgi:acyl-CoA dehydrogenase